MKFSLTEAELKAAVVDFVQRKTGLYRKMEVDFAKRGGETAAEVDIDILSGPTIAAEDKYQSAEEGAKAPKPQAQSSRAATKTEVKKAVEPKPEPESVKEDAKDLPPFDPDPEAEVAVPDTEPKKSLFGPA